MHFQSFRQNSLISFSSIRETFSYDDVKSVLDARRKSVSDQHSNCLHWTPISVHLHSLQGLESSVMILPTRYIRPYILQPASFSKLPTDIGISLSRTFEDVSTVSVSSVNLSALVDEATRVSWSSRSPPTEETCGVFVVSSSLLLELLFEENSSSKILSNEKIASSVVLSSSFSVLPDSVWLSWYFVVWLSTLLVKFLSSVLVTFCFTSFCSVILLRRKSFFESLFVRFNLVKCILS